MLVFALNLTDNLTFMARLYADCQMNLNSVERLQEYSSVPSEKYFNIDDDSCDIEPLENPFDTLLNGSTLPENWPYRGTLTFDCVTLKYQSSTNPVLKEVSFSIPSRQKVGIVGRTG